MLIVLLRIRNVAASYVSLSARALSLSVVESCQFPRGASSDTAGGGRERAELTWPLGHFVYWPTKFAAKFMRCASKLKTKCYCLLSWAPAEIPCKCAVGIPCKAEKVCYDALYPMTAKPNRFICMLWYMLLLLISFSLHSPFLPNFLCLHRVSVGAAVSPEFLSNFELSSLINKKPNDSFVFLMRKYYEKHTK